MLPRYLLVQGSNELQASSLAYPLCIAPGEQGQEAA